MLPTRKSIYSKLPFCLRGWTDELPKDYNDMFTLAQKAAQSLQKKYNTQYRVGSSTRILYAAAGGADGKWTSTD